MQANHDHTDEHSQGTSPSLILRAQAHEPEAWKRMVELYSPMLINWLRTWNVNPHDSADLLQEVWSSVASAIVRFKKEQSQSSLRGWLYQITRNKMLDFQRARARGPNAVGGTDANQLLHTIPEEESQASRADLKTGSIALVRRAIELARYDFEPSTFRAFWATTMEGKKPKDVAVELGLSIEAVYKAKCRVIRRLREELAGDIDLAIKQLEQQCN